MLDDTKLPTIFGLKQFLLHVKSTSTPVDLEKPLVKDRDADDVDVHLYRSMIGSLMYLITSRPDIMFEYKKQTVVATSTTKAEYVAAASCCRQGIGSDSAPRFQHTILGDVNAQTRFEITSKQSNDPHLSRGYTLGSREDNIKLLELMELSQLQLNAAKLKLMLLGLNYLKFAETHNVVAFLEKPVESDGFAKIIDFLKASSIHYALTVNTIFYTSCIEQFWATAKVQIVNGVRQSQALVDKKRVIITESSFTRDLHLDDAEEVPQDETEHEESVPTPSNDPQPSGEDSMQLTDLMVLCTKLQTHVLDLEKAKDAQAKEIAALKKRIQRLERKKKSRPTGLKRLKKVGMSRRVESSEDQESLGDPEDASKQGRSIADLDKDDDVTLVDETQERQDDELMFDTGVLDADEMHVEAKIDEKDEQSTKLDDSIAGE
ncbi:hypothetical protein Tco_1564172 [Tanacetum coccineum]